MIAGRATPGYTWLAMPSPAAKARRELLARVGPLVAEAARHAASAAEAEELLQMRFALADFEEALDAAIEVAG